MTPTPGPYVVHGAVISAPAAHGVTVAICGTAITYSAGGSYCITIAEAEANARLLGSVHDLIAERDALRQALRDIAANSTDAYACDTARGALDGPQDVAPALPAAPVAQPLTHMQIVMLWGLRSDGPSTPEIVSFTRAIERAHGIKGSA